MCQSNCYCDSYKGCKSCKPGYGLVGSECRYCDGKDGVSDCCFKEKTVVRATKCLDTLTQFYKLYGNYCYTVANC